MSFSFGDIGGSIVGGIFDTANNVLNAYYNRKAASKQYGYEKSLMDYQNEYNLPVNQRKRLEEAGLNPNLLYGGSTVNTVSADGHAPSVKAPQSTLGQNVLAMYNIELQNKLLASQINKIAEDTTKTELGNELTERKLKFEKDTGLDYDSTAGRIARFVDKWLGPNKTYDEVVNNPNSKYTPKAIKLRQKSEALSRQIDREHINSFYDVGRPVFSSGSF